MDPEQLERHNLRLKEKYDAMERDEVRYQSYGTDDDYDLLIVAYGTVARVCSTAIDELAERGIRAAMVRPVTLYPFPYDAIREAARQARAVLVVELSTGQMIEDVRLAVGTERPALSAGEEVRALLFVGRPETLRYEDLDVLAEEFVR